MTREEPDGACLGCIRRTEDGEPMIRGPAHDECRNALGDA